ncbi:hypothetical protein E4U60_000664 [Claviceps pazoutovae]|uniref:Uncharacterized protein n=1 Tax=Claviceps pazoutovae TaxID=1649127 RepID=A0A9P7SHA6_9HYPO|nr:hypothetical protein E4U60_000664 [Claviceps pazoutovae]
MVPYLDANWWPYRERFVNYSTNKIMAYGGKASSRVEGSHGLLKRWFDNYSENDIYTLVKKMLNWWESGHDQYEEYKHCLYVDDVCIESLDQDDADCPVVKILDKTWEPPTPEEIKEIEETEGLGVVGDGSTPAPFHDGLTDDWEENVGWMYMPVKSYLELYFTLVKWDWLDVYVRPPYIDWTEDESTFIGHWRNK